MDKFFDALKPDENPFAAYLYGEFKRTGDPKIMHVLIEVQEDYQNVKTLLQNEREK